MNAEEFKAFGTEMIRYIADYLENIKDRQVLPDVQPGYLRPLLADSAPEEAETWHEVMADVDRAIMPGVTNWQSPRFHAYFPAGQSYPSIVADILSAGIACSGFTWIASPACTELEVITLDWLGKMIGLPPDFLACSGGRSGGVIQGTASEATLVVLLGARAKTIKRLKNMNGSSMGDEAITKLVAYCSDQAHSSVERACFFAGVKLHQVASVKRKMHGEALAEAIKKDREAGLIPFFVNATIGTTFSCAFDELETIGDVTLKENIWLHVDAAYAGAAFICPEFRYLMKGIEKADSFNFNPHKWLLVNFDCSALWMKDSSWVTNAFDIDPQFMKNGNASHNTQPEYRHWQIPFGRRFRSLKLWFMMRLHGAEQLRAHIRKQVELARRFEALCLADERFEIVEEVVLGIVCFRLRGDETNELNRALLNKIISRRNIFLIPSMFGSVFFLRFVLCSRFTETEDVEFSFEEVRRCADDVIKTAGVQ